MLRSRVENYEQLNTNMAAQINNLQERLRLLGEDPDQDNSRTSHSANKRQNGTFSPQTDTAAITEDNREMADKRASTDGTDLAADRSEHTKLATETDKKTWAAKPSQHSKDDLDT